MGDGFYRSKDPTNSIKVIIIIIIVFIENCQNAVSYNKRNNKRIY